MPTKPSDKQPKKEENFRFKSLLPVFLFGTALVVVVSVIGRIATSK